MLKLIIKSAEMWDGANQCFIPPVETTIELEHSLSSLSKWEEKWERPFLGKEQHTTEQTIDYIKCMTLTPDVPSEVYDRLSGENYQVISEYIAKKNSATFFMEKPGAQTRANNSVVTAELIYYWMFAHQLPAEFDQWHLNRLLTLIRVCNEKNAPSQKNKKMSQRDLAQRNRDLNAARKKQLQTAG
jgi:hypothetical protein